MAITFSCTCSAEFEVPDQLAGLHSKCPACGTMLVVPSPPDDEPVSDVEVDDTIVPYRFADESRPYDYSTPEPINQAQPEVDDDEVEVVDDDVEVVDETEQEPEPDMDAEPVFFVAAYPPGSTLRQPKTLRFYSCGRELLALQAGPFGWGLVGTLMNRPGVREEFARRGHSGIGGGLGSDADEIARKKISLRAAVLDRMTLSELRTESESDKSSFKLTSDNTTKARIESPRPGMFEESGADDLVVGRLSFTHATAGKWDLVFLSQADAKMAMGAFRRVLGYDNVHVSLRLMERRT